MSLRAGAKEFVFNVGASNFVPGEPKPTPTFRVSSAPEPEPKTPTFRVTASEPEPEAKPTPTFRVTASEPEATPTPALRVTGGVLKRDSVTSVGSMDDDEALAQAIGVGAAKEAKLDAFAQESSWEDAEVDDTAKAVEEVTIAQTVDETVAEKPKKPKKEKESVNDNVPIVKEKKELVLHDEREHLNIVCIGHVDAGKSTISGQILLLTSQVDDRTIAKYEKEAKEKNRESWYLAYIMDTSEEERAKGKTVEVGRAQFETKNKRYTLLDAPGHRNYVPNMIGGAAQADVGVLVISARKGEFETGFDRGGQTREHAMLAKTLGIQRMIVLVNKMDDKSVKWAESRFKEVVSKLSPFLKQWGYNIANDVTYIPCSGLTGANLKTKCMDAGLSWYKGPPFFEVLDNLPVLTSRNNDANLRMPVMTRYKDLGSLCVLGKIESGVMHVGTKLNISPTGTECVCVGIEIDGKEVEMAPTGENVLVKVKGCDEEDLQTGFVLSEANPALKCRASCVFKAQMRVMDLLEHKPLLTAGYKAMLHVHTAIVECEIKKIIDEYDKKGKLIPGAPRYVKSHAVCNVIVKCAKTVAVEKFKDYNQLGRFTIRDEGYTIAVGKITEMRLA